jgi:hypothetical protein
MALKNHVGLGKLVIAYPKQILAVMAIAAVTIDCHRYAT